MKLFGGFFALFIGSVSLVYAQQESFRMQYVKPIVVKIFSDHKGVIKEEGIRCTPQTCCFSERFYCSMDNGRCFCDLHLCNQSRDKKNYWMEITGTEAERYCGRARRLHELTNLCLCDPDKDIPCIECNQPYTGSLSSPNPQLGSSVPQDCKHLCKD